MFSSTKKSGSFYVDLENLIFCLVWISWHFDTRRATRLPEVSNCFVPMLLAFYFLSVQRPWRVICLFSPVLEMYRNVTWKRQCEQNAAFSFPVSRFPLAPLPGRCWQLVSPTLLFPQTLHAPRTPPEAPLQPRPLRQNLRLLLLNEQNNVYVNFKLLKFI